MEKWDLYTKDRIPTGETMERGTKCPKDGYRMVIHVCIFNAKGQMLIQQRQSFKKGWSNLWDITVGGHAVAGDSSRTAAEREVLEEIGYAVSLKDKRPVLTVNFENGFDDFYLVEQDLDIDKLTLQYEEVQAVRWAEKEEILAMIDAGTFIPYHKPLIELLFAMRERADAHFRSDR